MKIYNILAAYAKRLLGEPTETFKHNEGWGVAWERGEWELVVAYTASRGLWEVSTWYDNVLYDFTGRDASDSRRFAYALLAKREIEAFADRAESSNNNGNKA